MIGVGEGDGDGEGEGDGEADGGIGSCGELKPASDGRESETSVTSKNNEQARKTKTPPALAVWSFNFGLTRVIRSLVQTPPASAVWSLNFNLISRERRLKLKPHATKVGGVFCFCGRLL